VKRSTGPRKTAELSKSLHRQLNAYALAASAAGVGVLALAPPAEAKIVYTRTHDLITPNSVYRLRLNHEITDFTFVNVLRCPRSSQCSFSVFQEPRPGNGAMGHVSQTESHRTFPFDLALPRGSRIESTNGHFYGGAKLAAGFWSPCAGSAWGPWAYATNRYLGLKLRIKGETHYGWARLSFAEGNAGSGFTVTLTGYAYETIAYKPIIAGKTKGPDVIKLEPGSLGHLAHGTSAIPVWRMQHSSH
jgi:hypothetical protein